jgi:hypothetical protein
MAETKPKPAGWFNPWNDYHGYEQVAEEFEGKPGKIPLYPASALTSLMEENERLKQRCKELSGLEADTYSTWKEMYAAAEARAQAAEQEIERLLLFGGRIDRKSVV